MNEMQTEITDRAYAMASTGAALYIARHSGLFCSQPADDVEQNLYQSWLPDQPLPTLALALSPEFAIDGLILAGINGGVARSEDAGETWQALQFRIPPPLVTCLALSPTFDSDGCVLAGSYEDGICRSGDGGRSWAAANFGLFDHNVLCLALSPAFAEDGLAFSGTSSGIYRSQNGGRLWQDLSMPSGDETVLSLALSPGFAADGGLYAGTEAHGLLHSSDGGNRWQRLQLPDGAVNSLIVSPGGDSDYRLIAQVDESALLSEDRGKNWQLLASADVDAVALADDASLLIALADGSVTQVEL